MATPLKPTRSISDLRGAGWSERALLIEGQLASPDVRA